MRSLTTEGWRTPAWGDSSSLPEGRHKVKHDVPRSGEAVSGTANLSYCSDQTYCRRASISAQPPRPLDERRVWSRAPRL